MSSFDVFGFLNLGWVGALIGLGGVVLSIITYHRSRRVARLRYVLLNTLLIEQPSSGPKNGLEIRYDGQPVDRVISSRFGLWNAGTETVHGRDIVEAQPICLRLKGKGEILRARIEESNRSANAVTLSRKGGGNSVKIEFDYLDPRDGFTATVIHSAEHGSLYLTGTIRGLPNGLEQIVPGQSTERVMIGVAWLGLFLAIPMLSGILIGAAWMSIFLPWPENLVGLLLLVLLGGIVFDELRPARRRGASLGIRGAPRVVNQHINLGPWVPPSRSEESIKSHAP